MVFLCLVTLGVVVIYRGAALPMTVGSFASAMADNGETKGLITPPPKWVSAQLLYVCVTAW